MENSELLKGEYDRIVNHMKDFQNYDAEYFDNLENLGHLNHNICKLRDILESFHELMVLAAYGKACEAINDA